MRRRALSNLALAKALGGVAHTTVARWKGGAYPRGDVARKLAEYFDVPVEALLDDSRDLPVEYRQDESREMHQVLEEAPAEIRRRFLDPALAWRHYLDAEALLDYLLAERSGKPLSEDDRRNFKETLRAFMLKRERGRMALHEATQLAEDIGNRVLGHYLRGEAQGVAGAEISEKEMDEARRQLADLKARVAEWEQGKSAEKERRHA